MHHDEDKGGGRGGGKRKRNGRGERRGGRDGDGDGDGDAQKQKVRDKGDGDAQKQKKQRRTSAGKGKGSGQQQWTESNEGGEEGGQGQWPQEWTESTTRPTICKFFLEGSCRFGTQCEDIHEKRGSSLGGRSPSGSGSGTSSARVLREELDQVADCQEVSTEVMPAAPMVTDDGWEAEDEFGCCLTDPYVTATQNMAAAATGGERWREDENVQEECGSNGRWGADLKDNIGGCVRSNPHGRAPWSNGTPAQPHGISMLYKVLVSSLYQPPQLTLDGLRENSS